MNKDDKQVAYFAILTAVYTVLSYIPLYFFYKWIASIWWEKWDLMTQFYHPDTEVIVGLITFLIAPAILGVIGSLLTIRPWNNKNA